MRWRDELDALSFESVSRIIAGGIALGGLVGAVMVGAGAIGGDDADTAAPEPSASAGAARSPVCLQVDPAPDQPGSALQAAISTSFPTAGDDLGSGWPQRVDGRWRWDVDEAPVDQGRPASGVRTERTVEDDRGGRWTWLRYRLDGLDDDLRIVVPESYVEDGAPEAELPDPADPLSVPPGASLLVDADVLGVDASSGAPGRSAVAVTPRTGDEVVVSIGTPAAVQRLAVLWPRTGAAHTALAPGDDLPTFDLRQLVLDVSSPEGRRAYGALLEGRVPERAAPGVQDVATVTGGRAATARARDLQAEGLDVPASFLAPGVRRTVREDADGTTTLVRSVGSSTDLLRFAEGRRGDRATGVMATIGAVGLDPATAGSFNRAYAGNPAEVADPVDLVLTLDEADLERLRADALWVVTDWLGTDTDGRRFARDLLRLDGLPNRADVAGWLRGAQPAAVQRVADVMGGPTASTPERAAAAVMVAGLDDTTEPWATFAAFGGALAGADADVATSLGQWGAAVARASRDDYVGPGDTRCTRAAAS